MEALEERLALLPSEPALPAKATLSVIDLAAWNLPMFDEPSIPSQVHDSSEYGQPHTRAWSAEVQKYSGFVFVLPQYNWGYPAVVKNAIDYLFNEWRGKSAMIISYGGHGGTHGAKQLRQVLEAVGMRVADSMPALTFPSRQAVVAATKGENINLLGNDSPWASEREVIVKAFDDLLALLREE
ncbi:hypothetical protein MMC25_008178 [Agyrium rufum]|nr:hypothetical protein [Agyrium rufum]